MPKQIRQIYKVSRETYGNPSITKALKKNNITCGKKRVARLMSKHGIVAKTKKKYKATTNSKHNYPVAENLVNQNFTASRPNQVWVADITYITNNEGWLYLEQLLRTFSIVSLLAGLWIAP